MKNFPRTKLCLGATTTFRAEPKMGTESNRQWNLKVGFGRNRDRVNTTTCTRENITEEVVKAVGCSGETRIPLLIWPIFAASRLLGLAPLAYKPTANLPDREPLKTSGDVPTGAPNERHSNQPSMKVSFPWLSLCVLALCVTLYAFIVEFRRLVRLLLDPKTDLKDYIYALPMLLNTAEGVVCVIRAMLAAKKFVLCLRSALATLRRIFFFLASVSIPAGLAPPPTGTALNIDGCAFLCFTFIYYSLVITVQIFYADDHEYIGSAANNASFIWCRLVPIVVETQFLLVTLLADRGLRALATAVENATSDYVPQRTASSGLQPLNNTASSRTSLLGELRRLHQQVFRVVELANEYFGPQLLFMIFQTRIQLLTDGYSVVASLALDGHSPYMRVLEACFLWTRIFHIIYRSELVHQQHQRILHLVYTMDSSSWDQPSSSKLHLLRRQVAALRPSLNACSFFTLDYNLLLSVVATTSTYLVVLVQFQG